MMESSQRILHQPLWMHDLVSIVYPPPCFLLPIYDLFLGHNLAIGGVHHHEEVDLRGSSSWDASIESHQKLAFHGNDHGSANQDNTPNRGTHMDGYLVAHGLG